MINMEIKEYIIDLQLFSEEKTEKPTHKKIQDSREKGQVLQSKEVNSAFMLLGAFISINLMGGYIGNIITRLTTYVYEDYLNTNYLFSITNIYKLMITSIYYMLMLVLPVAAICLIIGLVCSYMQVGYLFTTKTLEMKLSKLNPIEGFKRMFSMKSVFELVKSFIKIIFVGYVVFRYAEGQLETIFNTMGMETPVIIKTIVTLTVQIGVRAGMVLVALALLDYMYQKYEYDKNLKMTKQEIKEEYKQTEGNPQIKSKIKEKQRQISMRRMMQDVPKADVIITNPTHFAIAIKYDQNLSDAPMVVAKGLDIIAQRIKEIASENNVPMVENRPLARSLYDAVQVGQAIPQDMYQSVAEVLAYVYQLNNRTKGAKL